MENVMASNHTLTPLHVENLKRIATRRKRSEPGLTHSAALNQLATEHGFANWSLLAKAAGTVQKPRTIARIL